MKLHGAVKIRGQKEKEIIKSRQYFTFSNDLKKSSKVLN